MFENLETPVADPILQLAADYQKDPRPHKIDVGIGVFKDASGATPILDSVKVAEQRLFSEQATKSYVGLLGDIEFNAQMSRVILDTDHIPDRAAGIQTPGGNGALRICFDLINKARPGTKVWVPDPTWPNHIPTLQQAGLEPAIYPYFDRATGEVAFDKMLDTLKQLNAQDVVLFHGCCHNPTGASLTPPQWDEIVKITARRGFLPMVDFAYQGFGDGLSEDAYGIKALYQAVPEMLIAASCSKNFAIYRECTGIALAIAANAQQTQKSIGTMTGFARAGYSMPPDHGSAIVRTILCDPALKQQWKGEVDGMRLRISSLRTQLSDTFRASLGNDRFDALRHHKGMFSVLDITPEQAQRLRDEHAVYMLGSGRINIAGLRDDNINAFVSAIKSVL